MMETAPGDQVPKSIEEGQIDRERIVDAIDSLDPRSRWVFDAIAIGGKSYREVGRELSLSKTHVSRLFFAAREQLQAKLKDMIE